MAKIIIAHFPGPSPFRDLENKGGTMATLTLTDQRPTTWDIESTTIDLDDPAALALRVLDYSARRCAPPSSIEIMLTVEKAADIAPATDLVFLRHQAD